VSRSEHRENFWAREYFVSAVGRDEEVIRRYIQNQENEDWRQGQLKFG
jgi:putative transposase